MENVECPFDGFAHEVREEDDPEGVGMDLTAHALSYLYGLDPDFRGPDTPRGVYNWMRANQDAYRLRTRFNLRQLEAGFTGG